jgi:hypothetical protein
MSDARRVKELLRECVADFAQYLFPNGHREGNHWCVGSIRGEPGKSFKICIAGEKAGLWGDWAGGEKNSSNLLDLWMAARGVDFKTALREASDWLRIPSGKKKSEKGVFKTLENAIAFWARKLEMRVTRRDWYQDDYYVIVRFDKDKDAGTDTGADKNKTYRPFHREKSGWVTGDPPGKLPLFHLPKLLVPDLNPSSEPVFIVEGEKCACELETLGFRVTTSAHGARSAHKTDWEPLAGLFLAILPDNDETGDKNYSTVVTSSLFGLSPRPTIKIVHLPDLPPKGDIVDWMDKRDAREPEEVRAELLALVERAEMVQSAEPIDESGSPIKKPYTMMTPDEILALPVDPESNLLADNLLSKGGSLAIIGQPDLGKTRLILQLFVALILRLLWCGLETHAKDCRIVFFQSENSVNRLQQELERLKKWAGDKWSRVNDNLLIHVIKHDDDLSHYLSEPQNVSRMEKIVQDFKATIVAFDVLQDFKIGDLKADVDMEATVAAMKRITHVGDPNRSLIVVHHALTGRSGASKAFGFDRASFARGSKVILGTVRGAINVAPGTEDYGVLLLFCGKNNDGKHFPDTAIRLDGETMIYRVDEDFDIGNWKQQIVSSKASTDSYAPTDLRDWLQKGKEYSRQQIARIVMDETGRAKSWTYTFIKKATKNVLHYTGQTKIYKLR